jgi:hypothetical protein
VKEGSKAVAAGMNPMDLKRGIDLAVEAVNVWSLDFKYARYAKKLGDCAGTYGSAAPRWVSSGSVNSEPKPVRLGPGADQRLPPIVVYNNINLKWNLGPFCQKCVWRRPI